MGISFGKPSDFKPQQETLVVETDTEIQNRIVSEISDAFPHISVNSDVLADYYVSSSCLPFYEKNARGEMIEKQTFKEGENTIANYGDIFTGSLKQQVFVDLGYNTYLPVNDIKTGNILLHTRKLVKHHVD